MNDFCPTCLVDFDAMTSGQRALHECEGELVRRPCDPDRACRDALDDAGSSLEHSDTLNLEGMRDAANLYVSACEHGDVEVDASLVEDLVDVLDDASITSDDPAADAAATTRLLNLLGFKVH